MTNEIQPKAGDIYWVDFGIQPGSVQSGVRPGLVIQNNKGNEHSPCVIVLPMTTQIKKTLLPTQILLEAEQTGTDHDSMVLCANPMTISKKQLYGYVNTLDAKSMERVAKASMIAMGLPAFVDEVGLWHLRKKCLKLNEIPA